MVAAKYTVGDSNNKLVRQRRRQQIQQHAEYDTRTHTRAHAHTPTMLVNMYGDTRHPEKRGLDLTLSHIIIIDNLLCTQ